MKLNQLVIIFLAGFTAGVFVMGSLIPFIMEMYD